MRNITYTIGMLFLFLGSSLLAQDITLTDVNVANTFDEMEGLLSPEDDKIHVINFWSTWCKPCVAELPYFEQLHDLVDTEKVCVHLVSLDFEKDIEKKYIPFLNANPSRADQWLLLDGKYNDWIDKVDPSWSGAIPVTLFIQGDKKHFHDGDFHSAKEILDIIHKL